MKKKFSTNTECRACTRTTTTKANKCSWWILPEFVNVQCTTHTYEFIRKQCLKIEEKSFRATFIHISYVNAFTMPGNSENKRPELRFCFYCFVFFFGCFSLTFLVFLFFCCLVFVLRFYAFFSMLFGSEFDRIESETYTIPLCPTFKLQSIGIRNLKGSTERQREIISW